MDEIFLSVIIPTYKRSEFLPRAIDSVLNQKGKYEVIVVDDNDSDSIYRKENEKKLKKYEMHPNFMYLKHEKNQNGAAARNTGIKIAKGKYITFLDDDDEFIDGRIEEIQNAVLNVEYDFLCTGVIKKNKGTITNRIVPNINKTNQELQFELLTQKSFIVTGSNIICKAELVRLINGFDEKFIRHQDIEFLIRLLNVSETKYCIEKELVIKNKEDNLNLPDFEKLLNVKEMFLSKFSNLISNFSKEEQNIIISKNYYELLIVGYILNSKEYIKSAKKLLKEKNIYNSFKIIKIYIKIKLKKFKIVKAIRKIIKKI